MNIESSIKLKLDKILNPKKINININSIDTLVLSGGGVRGLYYIGIIKKLEELNIMKNINCIAGASIGAFFGSLIAIGFTSTELADFILLFNISKIKKTNMSNFFSFFGIDEGINLEIILEKMFEMKGFNKNITFGDFYKKTKKDLIITGVCINEKKCHYFSHTNTPDMKIIMGIRISTAIPLYFTPVYYDNKLWVDGGIIDNYPISLFKNKLDKTLGIYLSEKKNYSEISNLEDYFGCIIQSFSEGIAMKSICGFENNTIIILTDNMNFLNTDFDKNQIINFINSGYDYLTRFFF